MPHVTTETAHGVTTVRLARPEKKNALTVAMYDELCAALEAAGADDAVRVVLILGAPGAFCAGNDILDFVQNPPTGDESAVIRFLRALTTFDKPVVAGVDGAAVGIGTTLLLHCDLVYASTRSRFVLPFVKLGLVAEAASTLLLPLRVGPAKAAEWLLLGEPVQAEEAWRVGLVNELVPAVDVERIARTKAEALAALPPESVRITRRLMKQAWADAVQTALTREGVAFLERIGSAEAREAFMSFLAKGR